MILKIVALIATLVVLAGSACYYQLRQVGKANTEPLTSLIEEDQLSGILQRFYSMDDVAKTVDELKQKNRISLAFMMGGGVAVKPGVVIRSGESEWVVSIKDKSSFSFTKNGFKTIDGDGGDTVSATLLRDGSPFQSFDEKIERQEGDLLLVVHDDKILMFYITEKSHFYRPMNIYR